MSRLWRNWTFHNMVGHPMSEIAYLLGLTEWSHVWHDYTIPDHEPGTGRG